MLVCVPEHGIYRKGFKCFKGLRNLPVWSVSLISVVLGCKEVFFSPILGRIANLA